MIEYLNTHPIYGKYSFKKLSSYNVSICFSIKNSKVVDLLEFKKIEENVIPLFAGTQFGIYPNPDKIFVENDINILIGIQGKSQLSGVYGEFCLYEISFHESLNEEGIMKRKMKMEMLKSFKMHHINDPLKNGPIPMPIIEYVESDGDRFFRITSYLIIFYGVVILIAIIFSMFR